MNPKYSFLLSKFNAAEVQFCEFYRYFGEIGVIYMWILKRILELS